VWALPSMIKERLQVDASGNPTGGWTDPLSTTGGTVYPAVRVVNAVECEASYGGSDCTSSEENVAWATVRFRDDQGNVAEVQTDAQGIAFAPWAVPATAGLYTDTVGGLGIGVDPSLASVTLAPPPAEGTYQDHLGNYAVPLKAPKVKFEASVCSDKSYLLDHGLNPNDYDGSVTIPISLSGSSSDVAYLYWATDCYRTYFAFVVPQAPDFTNTLRMVFVDDLVTRFGFDPTNPVEFSAVPQLGDDLWLVERDTDKKSPTYGQWKVGDWHVSDDCTGSSKQSECGRSDTSAGHTNDLVPANGGAVYMLGTSTVYEFARVFPTDPANADSYDFTLPPVGGSTWIAFYLTSNKGNAPQADLEYPDFRVFLPIQIVRQ